MHALLLLSEQFGRDNWFTDDRDCDKDTSAREEAWRAGALALGHGVSSETGNRCPFNNGGI